eukprot:4260877-Prymnesium_polylepis.1
MGRGGSERSERRCRQLRAVAGLERRKKVPRMRHVVQLDQHGEHRPIHDGPALLVPSNGPALRVAGRVRPKPAKAQVGDGKVRRRLDARHPVVVHDQDAAHLEQLVGQMELVHVVEERVAVIHEEEVDAPPLPPQSRQAERRRLVEVEKLRRGLAHPLEEPPHAIQADVAVRPALEGIHRNVDGARVQRREDGGRAAAVGEARLNAAAAR